MRAVTSLVLCLLLANCGDCRDTRAAIQFCEFDEECPSDQRCEHGQCATPGSSWFEPDDNRPSTDAGLLDGGDTWIDDDDNNGYDPSDRLPPSNHPIEPAPDREPECQPTENSCAEEAGFCVGAFCIPKCWEQIDCPDGEVCRGDGSGGFECVEAIECGPGGGGGGSDSTCHQEWLDCSGNTYQVVCKALEAGSPPGFVEHTPMLCTCYENQLPGNRFEWLGLPCTGVFDIEVFYNEKCDWALPLPGHD